MSLITIPTTKKLLLYAGQLWDGCNSNLRKQVALILEKGVISCYIDNITQSQIKSIYPSHLKIFVPELTLIPGLIDCHVHLGFNKIITNKLEQKLLKSGILAVRDGGDKYMKSLSWAKQYNKFNTFPVVISTGHAIRKCAHYGSFLGKGIKSIYEVEPLIKNLVSKGAQQIKLIVTGIVYFDKMNKVGNRQFSKKEIQYIVKIANKYNLPVMAHANTAGAVNHALEAGVKSVEHGYFIDESSLDLFTKKGAYWIPTIAPVANRIKVEKNPKTVDILKKIGENHLNMINKALDKGAIVGIGSDTGAPEVFPGKGIHDEIYWWHKAGISPLQILKAATVNGVKIAGLNNGNGLLLPGFVPNLIGICGNPLNDPLTLKLVRFVFFTENGNYRYSTI